MSGGVRPQRLARQRAPDLERPIPRRSEDGHPRRGTDPHRTAGEPRTTGHTPHKPTRHHTAPELRRTLTATITAATTELDVPAPELATRLRPMLLKLT
ncbi:hypothetical protein [Streptomyces sp. NPDC050548]|uniref:hypothetical protein n=1 Tax=Streptomyces sp. NPDC050548 TaxID=3365629 RepID=UPI0037BA0046